jgi:hypothetical protein
MSLLWQFLHLLTCLCNARPFLTVFRCWMLLKLHATQLHRTSIRCHSAETSEGGCAQLLSSSKQFLILCVHTRSRISEDCFYAKPWRLIFSMQDWKQINCPYFFRISMVTRDLHSWETTNMQYEQRKDCRRSQVKSFHILTFRRSKFHFGITFRASLLLWSRLRSFILGSLARLINWCKLCLAVLGSAILCVSKLRQLFDRITALIATDI